MTSIATIPDKPLHDWLKTVHVAFVPGTMDALLEEMIVGVLDRFRAYGHIVQERPTNETDILITTAPFGKNINWRKSLTLTSRIKFKLDHNPAVFTMLHAQPQEFEAMLARLEQALQKEPPDPKDFEFEGLASKSFHVLLEQGRRGGPILALERILQAQVKGVRLQLVVGAQRPERVYHFDLVGAYPQSYGDDAFFYDDIVLRMVTTVSTHEVTDHEVVGDLIPYSVWQALHSPEAMRTAALEFGRRNFFTDMVHVKDLVQVPAVEEAVSNQYSEGCFATWEPQIDALIATITGSARPVDKDNISEDELAILTGVRPGGEGAYVRHVQGKRNDPPSSEAVEMMAMDQVLPRVQVEVAGAGLREVPVVRSKLHGHRGVAAYDPTFIEYVPLNAPYFHYLVSCATEAQAHAVRDAFSRSQTLQNPTDPRQLAFTILPGHGLVVVEKWQQDKMPFQLIWEAMDSGQLQIDSHVPQGPIHYEPNGEGEQVLVEDWLRIDV